MNDAPQRVTCIDEVGSQVLERGKEYYAFEASWQHVYISNFPNKRSHMGCFHKDRFRELQHSEPPKPLKRVELEKDKWYTAEIKEACKYHGGGTFNIKSTHGVYFNSNNCYVYKGLTHVGRYGIDEFTNIREIDAPIVEGIEAQPEQQQEIEQLDIWGFLGD